MAGKDTELQEVKSAVPSGHQPVSRWDKTLTDHPWEMPSGMLGLPTTGDLSFLTCVGTTAICESL